MNIRPVISRAALLLLSALCTRGAPPATSLLDIAGRSDLSDPRTLDDSAATQLTGLCSLSEFSALPEADRHVYSFDVWPGGTDNLGTNLYSFRFRLGDKGVSSQQVTFQATGGGPGGSHNMTRSPGSTPSRYRLTGLGNLDWGGKSQHTFTFDKPVIAFGVVLQSSGDFELRKFYWQAAKELNGYPVSYTLADGSIVQLGVRELRGALLKAGTNAFIGVIDRSGRGITSVTYTIRGLAGNKAQSICISEWAFATLPKPAVSPVINLRSSCDFDDPGAIVAAPSPALDGLTTLDAFRFIVGNHRYVYRFDTWPSSQRDTGSGTAEFAFDLKGKGAVGQKVKISAVNAARTTRLVQMERPDEAGLPRPVLGGLGDIGKGAWAEQTVTFEKPVWSVGITYGSSNEMILVRDFAYYTLADGTRVNLGKPGAPDSVIAANRKTFVGVIDQSDKGISSITLRVKGTANGIQPLTIEDLAFAVAGPPPGDWKLTLQDEFDGNTLNTNIWQAGYTYVDIINNELQGYVPENISVSNGICTIKVELRECRNTDRKGHQGATQKFASGAFTSFDKFTQTYGYFEARVKMTKAPGPGTWPAFWMLPDRGRDYPSKTRTGYITKDYGRGIEIDIFEFMPWWKTLEGRFPVHVGCIWSYGKVTEKDPAPHGYGAYGLDNDGWGPRELTYPDADTQFHTYGLYWSPERLIFYLDSKPIFRVKDPKHVPDVPHYFLFNVALSGNGWGKSPDKKHPTHQQIVDGMPNRMEIDYFRAYSGVLEEAIPAPPSDIPTDVKKYSPPKTDPVPVNPAPAAPAAPETPSNAVPAAPVNSQISSPSGG